MTTPTPLTSLDVAAYRVRVEELRAEMLRRAARRVGKGIASLARRITRG